MRRSRTNSDPTSSTADAASRERGPQAAARPVLAEVAGRGTPGAAAMAGVDAAAVPGAPHRPAP